MDISDQIYNELSKVINKENIKQNEVLKQHLYTKLGGKADFYLTPTTYKEVQEIVKLSNQLRIPFTLLGNGSNLIVKDGGIRGFVVHLKKLNTITVTNEQVIAQSGAAIIDASRRALTESLTGFEFACGIPGTVGGALFMNAGAYGGEIKDILEHCLVIDQQGEIKTRNANELELNYRHSNLSLNKEIVLEATFRLRSGEYPIIKAIMDDFTFKRESNQPLDYPSCGSVFKRPPGYFAGQLIQDSELQGTNFDGAEVSMKHAGFIINKGNASAKSYISLIEHVQETVKKRFNVELEREVRIIGEEQSEYI